MSNTLRLKTFGRLRLRTFGGLRLENPGGSDTRLRPRPLALLASLAVAGPKGATRDRLLGILWPESDEARARHALSQALYLLRAAAGDVVLAGPVLRLDPDRIVSDLDEFRIAVIDKRWNDAAALYTGPFLDGFYLAEASDFERWAASERAALATEGVRAIENAARAALDAGRPEEAVEHWRHLTHLDPADPRVAVAYMEALGAVGDRATALAHGRAHADLIRREFEVEPDPAVVRLMRRLREAACDSGDALSASIVRMAVSSAAAGGATDPDKQAEASGNDESVGSRTAPTAMDAAPTPGAQPTFARTGRPVRARIAVAATGMAAAVALAALGGWRAATASPAATVPVRAVGRVGAESLAEAGTRSPVAHRLYEEGLRVFYQSDAAAAYRLFRSAIKDDSLFAMATYYAWRAAKNIASPDVASLAERAAALASHASPRDRLLILTHVGADRWDPRALPAAESLAARYPRDPEALLRAAEVVPDLPRAVALLERSIAIDSAAASDSMPLCRLCDSFGLLAQRYEWADSAEAVERTLARWQAIRPHDPSPWVMLGDWRIGFGRRTEADAAFSRYEALGGAGGSAHAVNVSMSVRLDDLAAAEGGCREGLETPHSTDFLRYRWYCVMVLRMQGRYRDAIALARHNRVPGTGVARHHLGPEIYQAALLDMEMGRALAAADEFRAIDRDRGDTARATASRRAHNAAWLLTLSATAAVAGGDTVRARALADTIETLGRQSLFARDPKLHHFIRGLLHAQWHEDEAAVRELYAALSSPTFGYTRINYELGRLLLKLGRPGEAIPLVEAALHGGIEGSGLYVNRTEMHELLAQLFDATGQRDSAAAHYAVIARAWASADPMFQPRRAAAERWLATPGRAFERGSGRVAEASRRARHDRSPPNAASDGQRAVIAPPHRAAHSLAARPRTRAS